MKKLAVIIVFLAAQNFVAAAQSCVESAKMMIPQISEESRKVFEAKLTVAKTDYEKYPGADTLIWIGRRTAYLGDYKEAIKIFSDGIGKYPKDARLYRHRGHRYISIRCFDDAISDFRKAAKLIKGKADVIEPDGMPNARNIPTSTLQSNIWYHLGLAYYLKGDFENALKAYKEAKKVSKNPDMLVATIHWQYMTLRRLGNTKEAARQIEPLGGKIEILENDDYLKLIKLYRGELTADALVKEIDGEASTLGNASLGYGLGNWFLYNGNLEQASRIFEQIKAGDQWASFGFIAAEAESNR